MDSVNERKDYSLEMYGARDYLDSFSQRRPIATILHSWPFYALILHLMVLYSRLAIATRTLHFLKHP